MKLQWEEDQDTYKYKTLYSLELETIKTTLVYDIKDEKVVTGTVIIKGAEYIEPNMDGLSISEAKRRLMWAAINIGSSRLMKNSDHPLDQKGRKVLVDNLDQIYIMIEQDVSLDKMRFKAKFKKGKS